MIEKHVYNKKILEHHDFTSVFNGNTGMYCRIEKRDRENSILKAEYPELIDIGIMETCVCSSKCNIDCYQKACNRHGNNMTFENYKRIIDESAERVYQVALGGAGDPDTHENFKEILEYTASNNIVPNYTTSGIVLTKDKAELSYKYCGAVAVSEHHADYTDKAIKMLMDAGVNTNVHFVLNTDTIDEAISILKAGEYRIKGINAIVFLLYKPVGLGKEQKILTTDNEKVKEFFSLVNNNNCRFNIGFDSCSCSGLVNFSKNTDYRMIDYCEGGRFSMYISSDMKAFPCSFANQSNYGIDLKEISIETAWSEFEYFREKLSNSCIDCKDRKLCMGGCPLLSGITLCNRTERSKEFGLIER